MPKSMLLEMASVYLHMEAVFHEIVYVDNNIIDKSHFINAGLSSKHWES